jgi:Acyltransferase family.
MPMNHKNEEVISKSVDLLRFPLAMMVLFIHTTGYVVFDVMAMQAQPFTPYSVFQFVCIMITEVLSHIAVPTFFLFSGYFFFYKLKEWNLSVYWGKIRKRIFTLFIPYIMWNLILLLVRLVVAVLKGTSVQEFIDPYISEGLYRIFWDIKPEISGPLNFPMWFVRNLMFLCLLSPLIYIYVKHLKVIGLALLVGLYLFRLHSPFIGVGFGDLCFFSIGAYFAINRISFVEYFAKTRIAVGALTSLLLVMVTWYGADRTEIGAALFPFYVLFGVCTAINMSSFLIEKYNLTPNRFLANSSFFIYASHIVYILYGWDYFLCRLIPPVTWSAKYLVYFGVPILATATCLLIYYCLQRYVPRMLYILTGNR